MSDGDSQGMYPRLPGESEEQWRRRVAREVVDTKLVAELLEIVTGKRGVTDAERAALRRRISEMQHERDRVRALGMLAAEPKEASPGGRGH